MKFPLKISLKFKIAFSFIFLVIIMMATITYIFTIRELNLRVEQMKVRMERLANNIATIRSVETEDWDVYQRYIEIQMRLNPDLVYIAIFDEKGELKVHSLNISWLELGEKQNLSKSEQAKIIYRLDQRQLAPESQRDLESKSVNIMIGDKNSGSVKVGFSLVDLNDEMQKNYNRNIELAILFILLAIIIAYTISQRIVIPLGRLTKAMLHISQGNLNQELTISSHDEIGEMAKTFNFMTKGLSEKELIEKLSRELGFTIELKKIANLMTERITNALSSRQGFLFLKNKDKFETFYLISTYPQSSFSETPLLCPEPMCQYLQTLRNPILLSDLNAYTDFSQLHQNIKIFPNALLMPILINEEVIGIFLIDPKDEDQQFLESEKNFLVTLIQQGGLAIENALLYEKLTTQEQIKRELEIASAVQMSLLPQQNPKFSGLDIDGICLPATEIGGDYYDYFVIDDHTIGIAIADVAGKGASAAFYMAVIKGIMLSLTSVFTSPKQLLSELNHKLYGIMDRKVFVTMIYAIIDLQKKTLKFARAGHNALIYQNHNKSKIECLTPAGIGLGLTNNSIFTEKMVEQELNIQEGDFFLFYTDGITEAMNNAREEFGEKRLVDLMMDLNALNAFQVREKIVSAVEAFVQDAARHDDMTMVMVGIK
ncbi:SpoIIE family protein phosphatase [candidate division KSB1 bacterium]|nr:SpoIIE family protein phosphatase [candidate division KSB1 bacterium]